jgi:hypothetical protein
LTEYKEKATRILQVHVLLIWQGLLQNI